MSDTIAITGATGFVGGALIRRLAATGRQIQALIRPVSIHKRPADIAAKWVDGDLDDMESLDRLVQDVDAVVHCAGTVRGATQAQFNRVNIDGVARLVHASTKRHPVPRFLMISSLAAREPQLSYYAASKRQGEEVLSQKSGKLSWTVFRPCAVYGPGDRELLPVFRWMEKGIAPILGSGNGRFSMLYVRDLAEAVVRWLDHSSCQARKFELHDGNPGGYSWQDVIETIKQLRAKPVVRLKIPVALAKALGAINLLAARAFGYAPMLTPGKVRELGHANWVCDNAALNSATGWSPQILLPEVLQQTLGWKKA
jgi:nucleoside-diphosphate-sugar epimerase